MYVFLYLFCVSLLVCLSVHLSVHLQISLSFSVYLGVCQFFSYSLSLFLSSPETQNTHMLGQTDNSVSGCCFQY